MKLSKLDRKLIRTFNKSADTYENIIDALINSQHAAEDAKKNGNIGEYMAAKAKSGGLHIAATAVYRATSVIAETASSKIGTDVNQFSSHPRNWSFRKAPGFFEILSQKDY